MKIYKNIEMILRICLFYFNIQLNNCLQVQERSSILLVALEILRNSAPMLPQNILLETLEKYNNILAMSKPKLPPLSNNLVWNSPFSMKCKYQEKRHQNCYSFFSSNSVG